MIAEETLEYMRLASEQLISEANSKLTMRIPGYTLKEGELYFQKNPVAAADDDEYLKLLFVDNTISELIINDPPAWFATIDPGEGKTIMKHEEMEQRSMFRTIGEMNVKKQILIEQGCKILDFGYLPKRTYKNFGFKYGIIYKRPIKKKKGKKQ